jgi:tripartite-type tricarboxylate transporter receptor subunit TctC
MASFRNLFYGAMGLGMAVLQTCAAGAADPAYPTRPIKLIVPFAPGGSSDTLARIIGPELSSRLRQPVVIENKPGAGGNIGIDTVVKSAPDGYTIALASPGPIVVNVSLMGGLPYDPVKDLAPVALIADLPIVLVATKSLPVSDVQGLIAADKAAPGKLYFASAGVGTTMHLSGELFNKLAGTRLEHVPYKGAGAAIFDLLSGQVQLGFLDLPSTASHVKSGALKLLAVGNPKRVQALPETPTIAEAGIAGYETSGWFGVLAPAGTPPAVLERLHAALADVMAAPAVRARIVQVGIEPMISSPAQFGDFIRAEIPKWAEVIKVSGASAK